MNTLSKAVNDEVADAMKTIWNNPEVKSVVVTSAKPGCFIAGADIK